MTPFNRPSSSNSNAPFTLNSICIAARCRRGQLYSQQGLLLRSHTDSKRQPLRKQLCKSRVAEVFAWHRQHLEAGVHETAEPQMLSQQICVWLTLCRGAAAGATLCRTSANRPTAVSATRAVALRHESSILLTRSGPCSTKVRIMQTCWRVLIQDYSESAATVQCRATTTHCIYCKAWRILSVLRHDALKICRPLVLLDFPTCPLLIWVVTSSTRATAAAGTHVSAPVLRAPPGSVWARQLQRTLSGCATV